MRRKRGSTTKFVTKIKISPPLTLPLHCMTSIALRSLANKIDELTALHKKTGDTSPHAPCLSVIAVERSGLVAAHVTSGGKHFKLVYSHGSPISCWNEQQ